jgi:hypothetical protein
VEGKGIGSLTLGADIGEKTGWREPLFTRRGGGAKIVEAVSHSLVVR